MTDDFNNTDTIELAADVISAYVSNNPVPVSELPSLIAQVHQSLAGLSTASAAAPVEKQAPAVSIKKSVTPEYIVCLEDGKKFKSLKRHLGVHFGLTPDEYRAKWNLPADYPIGRSGLCGRQIRTRQEDGPRPQAQGSGTRKAGTQESGLVGNKKRRVMSTPPLGCEPAR